MENFLQSETAKSNQQNDQFRQRILDEEMLKNLPGGYHCCSAEDGYPFIYIGDGFLKILGWTKKEIETEFDNKYINLVHPEDKESVIDFVTEISTKAGGSNNGKHSVYRVLGKNGYRWIADDDAMIIIDGKPLFQGFITDITNYIESRDRHQEELESQLDIERHYLNVICWDYTSVFRIDLAEDIIIPLKVASSSFVSEMMKMNLHQKYTFTEQIEQYTNEYVIRSDRKNFQRALTIENLRKKLKSQPRFTFRYKTLPSPGGHSYFEVQAIRIEAAFGDENILLGFRHIDDIVAEEMRHRIEQKEHLERERIQNEVFMALGSNYDAIFRIDLQQDTYTQILCNDKIKDYYGNNPSATEMLNEVCKRVVSPKHYERMLSFFDPQTLPERLKERDFVEAECITKNGIWHRSRLIVKRRNKNGTVSKILYVTQIINDEKDYEEHLIAKAEYADLANRTKNSFISQVAHDIRTPMNSILGFLEIAESKLNNCEYDKVYYNLEKIRSASQFLKNLVNDILDISRIEEGKFSLQPEPTNLTDMLEDIRTNIQIASNKKEHIFIMDIHDISHNVIVTDILRFMQIYTNILTNAIKYTPSGGTITLTVFQEDIPNSNKVRTVAKISDTGIGMTEEFMKNMFNAFERATDTRINKVSGYGLGLTIAKQFVDIMGGCIDAESEIGKGTTFTVKLDTDYLDEDELDISVNNEIDNNICNGKHLLVAEDNELNREVITELLLMNNITCECTEDGKSCVERFQAVAEGTFDAILMDLQMPIMNGIDATRNIRSLPMSWAKTVPIIAMTANAMKEDIEKCLDAGMNAHLSKPIDMKQVLKTLADNLT